MHISYIYMIYVLIFICIHIHIHILPAQSECVAFFEQTSSLAVFGRWRVHIFHSNSHIYRNNQGILYCNTNTLHECTIKHVYRDKGVWSVQASPKKSNVFSNFVGDVWPHRCASRPVWHQGRLPCNLSLIKHGDGKLVSQCLGLCSMTRLMFFGGLKTECGTNIWTSNRYRYR